MNTSIAKGKWNEFKGELRKAWGEITDNEWEKTKGDLTSIKGLLQQKYGKNKEDNESKLTSLYSKFTQAKEDSLNNVKESLKN